MSETIGSGPYMGLSGSACGREIQDRDWSATPLGPMKSWSPSLLSLILMILGCPTPMFLAWGPKLNVFYNDAYIPILGPRVKSALGRPFADLWADHWAELRPIVEATLAGESRWLVDVQLDRERDGVTQESWWTFTFSPARNEIGAIMGLISLSSETTQRVVAERERNSTDRHLKRLISAGCSIGAWDWDVVADRVKADPSFALLYGVDPARAAEGAPIAEFFSGIHPDDRERVQAEVQEAMRAGGVFTSVYRLAGEGGIERHVVAQGRCIFDDAGNCVRFPGVSFDVTGQIDDMQPKPARLAKRLIY